MHIFTTLWHSVKGLCRKPHSTRKISVFASVTAIFFAVSHILAGRAENMVLIFLAGWIWVPLAVLFLIIRHGEVWKRRSLNSFFRSENFVGIDGRFPAYIKTEFCTRYLDKIRFQSRIPMSEWEKKQPYLEMFFRCKIYKIENSKEDITMLDIFIIKEDLPSAILWDNTYQLDGPRFAIGQSYTAPVIWDASVLSHGIVAGATGGGKTALLRCIIRQAIQKRYNVTVFDFKGGGDFAGVEREYHQYQDLEGGYGSLMVTEPEEARNLLRALTVEVSGRLAAFKVAGVPNLEDFHALGRERFVPWLIVIDEAAEILDVKPKDKAEKELYSEIDQSLRTLARTSRAAGVHLLFGIIRPDHTVLDGQIKNNALWRVCGYFADAAASRIVLENDRATGLPPDVKGRFIIGGEETQAYYLPTPKPAKD